MVIRNFTPTPIPTCNLLCSASANLSCSILWVRTGGEVSRSSNRWNRFGGCFLIRLSSWSFSGTVNIIAVTNTVSAVIRKRRWFVIIGDVKNTFSLSQKNRTQRRRNIFNFAIWPQNLRTYTNFSPSFHYKEYLSNRWKVETILILRNFSEIFKFFQISS